MKSKIEDRLAKSLADNLITGNAFARHTIEKQIIEAIETIKVLRRSIKELNQELHDYPASAQCAKHQQENGYSV